MNAAELKRQMADQGWRLNNLYYITNKDGQKVRFRMNWAQEEFWEGMWYNDIILKARQLGMSTFIGILQLDTILFNDDTACGTIAHDLESAEELFRRNIKYPYDHLPESLKTARPAHSRTTKQLIFPNGSSIKVATSMRSGTLQILHISEFGKICAKYPEKAREIVTGSLETVGQGNIVVIESTAEGREGYFYDYSQKAQALKESGKRLTKQDNKFFFFPWWKHPDYRSSEVKGAVITEERQKYFDELEEKIGQPIPLSRRVWYVKKAETLGEDMYREYPSTPEEAFHQALHGTYYKKQFQQLRREGRIGSVPHQPGFAVHTWWDLGLNDKTCIWFVQYVGTEYHVVDYYENSGEGLAHYAAVLQEKQQDREFVYGEHLWPHDGNSRILDEKGRKRTEVMAGLGYRVEVIQRGASRQAGIESVREILPLCRFDEERCDQGIKGLEHYRKEWDERKGAYKDSPLHDWASDPADAFRTGATAKGQKKVARANKSDMPSAAGWT